MTLRDAIEQTQNEYDEEALSFKRIPQLNIAATLLLNAELDEIEATDVIETILQGQRFVPAEIHTFVAARLMIALRLGMRIQRKLDHPEKTTTLFDSPCAEVQK